MGILNSGDRFVLEPAYAGFHVESSIGTVVNGPFQTIPKSMTISAVVEFIKYVVFNLTRNIQKESCLFTTEGRRTH